ncbi:hypothetical protein NL676_001721 [Syzygium grande]|nr:hypothetical protein NL676_001721 [Syzygium grande]
MTKIHFGQASNSRPPKYKVEELKLNIKVGGNGEAVGVSLDLTARGSLPLKLLGSYPGSIGKGTSLKLGHGCSARARAERPWLSFKLAATMVDSYDEASRGLGGGGQ